MRRNVTPTLDAFDHDVREAAREAARRAGLSVDEWLAATISQEPARPGARTRQRPARPAPRPQTQDHRPAAEAARARPAAPEMGEAVHALTRRLDEIDRRLEEALPLAEPAGIVAADPQAAFHEALPDSVRAELNHRLAQSREALDRTVSRAVEGLESPLGQPPADASGAADPSGLHSMLRAVEERITRLGERVEASDQRPIGRRGLPVQEELNAAVAEIRQRQQQIDIGTAAGPTLSPALAGLQEETTRLREALSGLATGRDLGAMEQAVRSLTDEVQRARQPEDLAAVVGPIDLIRVQVSRLADEVAADVHGRLAADVERLSRKIDGVVGSADAGSLANRDAIESLFGELDAIRRQIAGLATPDRIQSLARSVDGLSERVAALVSDVAEQRPVVAELRPLLEEIRTGLQSPAADSPAITRGLADLDRKLDDLRAQSAASEAPHSDAAEAIIGRIDALAAKVDRVAAASPGAEVIERLEQLGETLRRPAMAGGDLASIHGMLRSLADKVDRVAAGASGEALDVLEKQVLALAGRIETRGSDPALASLERTMGDLLAQVALMRDEAPIQAAAERAARHAVADSMGGGGKTAAPAADQFQALQATLSDLRAQQEISERRVQAAMHGVHTALEHLVTRLTHMESDRTGAGPIAPSRRREAPVRETLKESVALPPRAPRAPTPAAPAPEARSPAPEARPPAPEVRPAARDARPADEMLEPGTSRPRPGQELETPEPLPAGPASDIKASFIAAARRAAQAAAAEASVGKAAARPARPAPAEASVRPEGAGPQGLVGQLRATIERRRRPLLLGLAAVILALGTLQALNGLLAPSPERAAAVPVVAAPATPAAAPIEAAVPAPAADPATTQALPAEAAPSRAAATRPPDASADKASPVPRVAAAALAPDLAGLPPSLASLRQAALEGDGAALYEIASREADGRGIGRDLAVSAKLFEKLAQSGYAPAQYRLGSQYEKGMGVTRDPAQARTWYGKAAEQGHVRAMHNLAVLMAESGGAGGKPDYAAAATWFRRAAEFGVRDSQYNLAVLVARGLGVPQDLGQSYVWFAAAAAQGDEDAGRKRDEVAGKLAPKDLATAKTLAAAWKPKVADPAVNDAPAPRAEPAAQAAAPMSLIGAPPPITGRRPEVRASGKQAAGV